MAQVNPKFKLNNGRNGKKKKTGVKRLLSVAQSRRLGRRSRGVKPSPSTAITYREAICDVVATTDFKINEYPLYINNSVTFPWCSNIGKLFSKWRIRKMKLTYISTNATMTNGGPMLMAIQRDFGGFVPTSVITGERLELHKVGNINQTFSWEVPTKEFESWKSVTAAQEIGGYGYLYLGWSASTAATVGRVEMEVTVDFMYSTPAPVAAITNAYYTTAGSSGNPNGVWVPAFEMALKVDDEFAFKPCNQNFSAPIQDDGFGINSVKGWYKNWTSYYAIHYPRFAPGHYTVEITGTDTQATGTYTPTAAETWGFGDWSTPSVTWWTETADKWYHFIWDFEVYTESYIAFLNKFSNTIAAYSNIFLRIMKSAEQFVYESPENKVEEKETRVVAPLSGKPICRAGTFVKLIDFYSVVKAKAPKPKVLPKLEEIEEKYFSAVVVESNPAKALKKK